MLKIAMTVFYAKQPHNRVSDEVHWLDLLFECCK